MADTNNTQNSPPPPPPPAPPAKKAGDGGAEPDRAARRIAFAIEIAGSKNESVLFPFDQSVLRGRWSRQNLAGKSYDEQFARMPDLPGIVVVVNTARRRIRRFDPLAHKDNERLLRQAKRVVADVFGTKQGPDRERVWNECDDHFLKSVAFWALREVDLGRAKLVNGRMPSFEDVKAMPGLVHRHLSDSGASAKEGSLSSFMAGTPVPNDKLRYQKPTGDGRTDDEGEDAAEPVVAADLDDRRGED